VCPEHPDQQPAYFDENWYCEGCIDPDAFADITCPEHPTALMIVTRHDDGGTTLACEAATHMWQFLELLSGLALNPEYRKACGRRTFNPADALCTITEETASLEQAFAMTSGLVDDVRPAPR
jgi:hypothetical protein